MLFCPLAFSKVLVKALLEEQKLLLPYVHFSNLTSLAESIPCYQSWLGNRVVRNKRLQLKARGEFTFCLGGCRLVEVGFRVFQWPFSNERAARYVQDVFFICNRVNKIVDSKS